MSGRIARQEMGGLTPLLNLMNDISLRLVWIGAGYCQPFFELSDDQPTIVAQLSIAVFSLRKESGIEIIFIKSRRS